MSACSPGVDCDSHTGSGSAATLAKLLLTRWRAAASAPQRSGHAVPSSHTVLFLLIYPLLLSNCLGTGNFKKCNSTIFFLYKNK